MVAASPQGVVTSAPERAWSRSAWTTAASFFYIAGGVVAGLIAVFAIAHTSRMSSFLQ